MRLSQKCSEKTGPQAVIDYLRNGLREYPMSHEMLYNYAVAHERLGYDEMAVKFFRFASKVK